MQKNDARPDTALKGRVKESIFRTSLPEKGRKENRRDEFVQIRRKISPADGYIVILLPYLKLKPILFFADLITLILFACFPGHGWRFSSFRAYG